MASTRATGSSRDLSWTRLPGAHSEQLGRAARLRLRNTMSVPPYIFKRFDDTHAAVVYVNLRSWAATSASRGRLCLRRVFHHRHPTGTTPSRLGGLQTRAERWKTECVRGTISAGILLERTFSDSEFEDSVASYMQSWLPNVPTPSQDHFKSMTKEEAYKTTFGYVQYYAVGLEQAVLDQIFHNGPFHRLFLEIQQNLGQLLCELQIGIVHFNVAKNPDVLRDVMSHEYRDIKQDSQRNLRDYIILREYIRLTRYISELFAYLRDHS
ncbi:uncharacterized protein [Dermacentor albipictus]|uniref:uncharacterized protein isoform X2 n=1 Tax=Dermacentor albipictus TaxID=60249 RepID=UPI0031FD7CA0